MMVRDRKNKIKGMITIKIIENTTNTDRVIHSTQNNM